jgi:hypothetical protein
MAACGEKSPDGDVVGAESELLVSTGDKGPNDQHYDRSAPARVTESTKSVFCSVGSLDSKAAGQAPPKNRRLCLRPQSVPSSPHGIGGLSNRRGVNSSSTWGG